jgi:hypothetical protein
MADDTERFWYQPNSPQPAARPRKPGELLFDFVRESDRQHFRFGLRFHGVSPGYELQILKSGELMFAPGGFSTRAKSGIPQLGDRGPLRIH